MTEAERKEIAERFRQSGEVWEAVENWANRRLVSTRPQEVDRDLLDRFLHLLNWYETTPVEQEEESVDHDGPWEAA